MGQTGGTTGLTSEAMTLLEDVAASARLEGQEIPAEDLEPHRSARDRLVRMQTSGSGGASDLGDTLVGQAE
jgi:hypothetical protein